MAEPTGAEDANRRAYIEFLSDAADFISDIRRGQRPNVLLMRTFSKIFGLAGLRLGYGIGNPELITALEKIRQPFNINSIAQAAGLKLYVEAFQKLGLQFVPSAGNFILVHVKEGQRVFEAMQKLGVIVRPMGGYQLPEWIRISVGTPEENQRCLESLKKSV